MSYTIEEIFDDSIFQLITVELKNYNKKLESLFCYADLDRLEKSIKRTDEILLVCTNVDEVIMSVELSYIQIIMKCDRVEYVVNVSDECTEIILYECGHFISKTFQYDSSEFLELFSKTPFYRPNDIKIAIKD